MVDSVFQQPPFAGLGIPGPDGDFVDVGTNGLPVLDDEDRLKMKPEELEALEQVKAEERVAAGVQHVPWPALGQRFVNASRQ